MAFTSIDLVRAHLAGIRQGEFAVREIAVVLNGLDASQLPHTGIDETSIVVKALRSNMPEFESRALGNGWVILNHPQLIPGTVLVASDSSLGIVYTENVDFIVDAPGGRVKRLSSGAISELQAVSVWYSYYHVYAEGDDFALDAAQGRMTRKSGGSIADGQQVLVDYSVQLGTIADDVIEQAINESAEAVLALVSDTYHDDPAPGLVIGATHLAVAHLARMRAAAALSESGSASRSTAQDWLDIATRYDQTARAFLSRFANPLSTRPSLGRG